MLGYHLNSAQMTKLRYIYSMLFTLLMVGCTESVDTSLGEASEASGYGSVTFSTAVSGEVLITRAQVRELDDELIPTTADFALSISGSYTNADDGELVLIDSLYSSIDSYNQAPPTLCTNDEGYTAQISCGDPTAEGEDLPYFEGESTFYVVARTQSVAQITASLTNSIIEFSTSEWFDLYYSDAEFTVTTSAGNEFTFGMGSDPRQIFLPAGTTLTLKGSATKSSGAQVEFAANTIGETVSGQLSSIEIDASQVSDAAIAVVFDSNFVETEVINLEFNENAPLNE